MEGIQMEHAGERVKQLREKAGMSLGQLAKEVGLTPDKLSKAEHGKRRLGLGELLEISDVLGTTVQRLLGREAHGSLALAARIADAGESPNDHEILIRANQLLELDHLLGQLGASSPRTSTEQGDLVRQYARAIPTPNSKTQANKDGKDLAVKAREMLSLGSAPIGNLAELAERHFGIDVECTPFSGNLSGACIHQGDRAIIFATTAKTSGHLRFTLAHELGHHLFGDPREVVIESDLTSGVPSERRVNAFATHFLMPASEIGMLVRGRAMSEEVLAQLMQHFQVSLASLVSHLADCGVVPFASQSLWLAKSARALISEYGDPGALDPCTEDSPARPPARLVSSARAAQRQGFIGPTIIAALLRQPVQEPSTRQHADVTKLIENAFANL